MRAKTITSSQVGKLFNAQPPNAPEAEIAVLGSLLLDPACTPDVADLLTAEEFFTERHAAIYGELLDHYRVVGDKADMVMLNQRLRDKGVLDNAGGVSYLIELAESVPSSASVGYYARIVRDKARLRKLIGETQRVLYDCYHLDPKDAAEQAPELIDRALTAVSLLADETVEADGSLVHQCDAMAEARAEVEYRQEHPGLGGLATGFHELDEALDGLRGGQEIVVAARPSIGKTAFAVNVAENIADRGNPVAVFSVEMSAKELAKRILSSRSGVPLNAMRRPNTGMRGEDWQSLTQTVLMAKDKPLYICDTPNLTLERLTAMSQKLVTRRGVKCIVVDYLQLMTAPKADNREQAVAALSRGIKLLARRLDVPVIVLAQVNRSAEGENPGPPMAKHIRESGAVEQDADVILALHRDDFYRIQAEPDAQPDHKAIVAIRKQRNGPQGTVALHFDAQRSRFSNPTPIHLNTWGFAGAAA